ncbi:tetratricopeptide repeat protein [Mucilaginibacter sp. AK015]|uniref:tetratricopeptide repeat-containing sensor histidine kinase n=1 Tax=Mucilaginibacter sp. AK015 TaxID=2723072 RepID=UPI0016225B6F|nr:tetratricopeptide repeat protein [Mucilaginibacter sp. AK015]MBB5396717.1 signal transduction histidine kinase [Mucilaginibacter sp. AK015]
MKYLFCFFLFLTAVECLGQNIDSLNKIVLGNAPVQKRLNAAIKGSGHPSVKNANNVLTIAKPGLRLAVRSGNKPAVSLLSVSIGKAYYFIRRYDSAAYYYDAAANVSDKSLKENVLPYNYAELAKVYALQKNYDKAIELYNKAILYAPVTGPRRLPMAALNKIGELYEARRDYQNALNYFRRAYDISDSLDLVERTKKNTSEAYSRDFIGDVMEGMRHKTSSVEDILKAIDTKKAINDTLALTINYFNLGILCKSKQQYSQALEALQKCLQYATNIYYTEMQGSVLNELTDLYEQVGNHRQALVYLKKRIALSAPGGNHISKTMDELQTKYEITQREDQVLRQQFEITKRNYWVAGISVIAMLMFLTGYIYYKQTRLRQRNIAMQAIIATEESERKRIAQDLHDGVSQTMTAAKMSLRAIANEMPFVNDEQQKRLEKAISLVDEGFREVRTISHNMMPWALNETGLATVIKQFISNIENETITINFFCKGFDQPFNDTVEIILYRVLQESLHNVMKHASASRIDISLIKDEQGNISLTIEDNGKGFDAARPETYQGMGLNNLRSRIMFLKGKVELSSKIGQGTLVSVYVPA